MRLLDLTRRQPTFPLLCSIIGAEGLNGRVRNGNGCDPSAMVTGMNLSKKMTTEDPGNGDKDAGGAPPFQTLSSRQQFP